MAGASQSEVIRFLLDADTAIFAMRQRRRVRDAIATAGTSGVAISSLVYSQLLQGVPLDPLNEPRRIKLFVASIRVLPYDFEAAGHYGRIIDAVGFSRRHAVDRMIAAHAISLNATLVTNNIKDFAGIPDLAVTNWAAP